MDVNLQNVLWLMTWMGSVRFTIFFLWRLIRNLSPLNKPCTGYYNTDDQIFFPTVSHTLHLLIHPFRSCNAAVILTHPEKTWQNQTRAKILWIHRWHKFMFLSLAKCSVFFSDYEIWNVLSLSMRGWPLFRLIPSLQVVYVFYWQVLIYL